jgi:hypothetical protein
MSTELWEKGAAGRPSVAVLRLGHRPAPTLELGGELVGGYPRQRLRRHRRTASRRSIDGSFPALRVLEPVDEYSDFVTGELARRLALGESHGAPGIAEVGVAGVVQQSQELLDLFR